MAQLFYIIIILTLYVMAASSVFLGFLVIRYPNKAIRSFSIGFFGSTIAVIILSILYFVPPETLIQKQCLLLLIHISLSPLIYSSPQALSIALSPQKKIKSIRLFLGLAIINGLLLITVLIQTLLNKSIISPSMVLSFFDISIVLEVLFLISAPTFISPVRNPNERGLKLKLLLNSLFFPVFIRDLMILKAYFFSTQFEEFIFTPIYMGIFCIGILFYGYQFLFKKQNLPIFIRTDHLASKYTLTKREKEILQLVINGFNNHDIASHSYISVSTVKKHLKNIFAKTDVNSKTKLIAKVLSENY